MPFRKGKMNCNDPSTTPLVSVTTNTNYIGEMMEALEQGDSVALKSAIAHLSPSELNGCFTHSTSKVFTISPIDHLPLDVRTDLYQKDMINISPVHYAASIGDKPCLEILLAGGADPNLKDGLGQTPLHILPKGDWRHNTADFQGCLDLLLAHEHIDANRLDLSKSSPLSRAEECQWSYMKNKLKEMGIDGNSALRRSSGGQERKTVFADALLKDILDSNLVGFTSTLSAIKASGTDKRAILDESHGSYTLLQYACKCCKFDFVDELLHHEASPTKKEDVNILSSIMWATKYGYHRILQRLFKSLEKEDFQKGVIKESNEEGETLLHLSTMCSHTKDADDVDYFRCLQILLTKKEHLDIDATNRDSNSALHFAALCEDIRAFTLLLKQGANCTNKNVFGFCAMQYIHKEGMMKILHNCIEFDSQKCIVDKDFWVEINYKMMQNNQVGEDCNGKEMTFINKLAYIFQDKDILHHPLIDIFVYLKWQNIKKFFHLSFILHVIFLGLLLTYICIYHRTLQPPANMNTTNVVMTTPNPNESIQNANISRSIFIAFLLLALLLREVAQLIMMESWKEYISRPKNIAEVITAVLAVLLLCVPFSDRVKMAIAAWLVLVSLLEFILHLGRFPAVAVYITMFKAVSWNFFKFICLFFIIILAFSFSFYLMFQVSEDFKTFPESLLKTIIMTTGEVEYSELPVSAFPVASHALMVLFVFLILLVLMNLLNGLAISDIQEIQKRAEIISCMSLIDRMAQLERAFYCAADSRNPFKRILTYFFRITFIIKKCLTDHRLTVYISQHDSATRPTICDCNSYTLKKEHIRALKRIVMEKKGATCPQ